MFEELLLPMYDDDYYPNVLINKIKQHVVGFAKQVNQSACSDAEIYQLATEVLQKINHMKAEFADLDSSLDDAAADYIAEALMMVVQEAGYLDIEMEELIAAREW